jgi:hypothetical protein
MSQTQKPDAMQTLTLSIHEVIEKLAKLPSNQELENTIIQLVKIAEDIKTVARNSFDRKSDFDEFKLVIHWNLGARVYSPESNSEIALIENECLEQKTVYECLKQKFADKTPILNSLLKTFAWYLGKYAVTLEELLTKGEEEGDP